MTNAQTLLEKLAVEPQFTPKQIRALAQFKDPIDPQVLENLSHKTHEEILTELAGEGRKLSPEQLAMRQNRPIPRETLAAMLAQDHANMNPEERNLLERRREIAALARQTIPRETLAAFAAQDYDNMNPEERNLLERRREVAALASQPANPGILDSLTEVADYVEKYQEQLGEQAQAQPKPKPKSLFSRVADIFGPQ